MEAIAVIVGRFIGAVLAECGPVLVRLIRACFQDTAEDSKADDTLRDRLRDAIRRVPSTPGSKDGVRSADATSAPERKP